MQLSEFTQDVQDYHNYLVVQYDMKTASRYLKVCSEKDKTDYCEKSMGYRVDKMLKSSDRALERETKILALLHDKQPPMSVTDISFRIKESLQNTRNALSILVDSNYLNKFPNPYMHSTTSWVYASIEWNTEPQIDDQITIFNRKRCGKSLSGVIVDFDVYRPMNAIYPIALLKYYHNPNPVREFVDPQTLIIVGRK